MYTCRHDRLLGLCWQHGGAEHLGIKVQADLDKIKSRLEDGHYHILDEFTAIAVGAIGERNYSARVVVGLPHCKAGTSHHQKALLSGVVEHW